MNYKRLTLDERERISRMLAQGRPFQYIARKLDRSVSTISREVAQGSCNRYTYRAARADRRAGRNVAKRQTGHRKLLDNPRLCVYIHAKLALLWSPEQIVHRLRQEYADNPTKRVSHEAIYTYLFVLPKGELKKELLLCLRHGHKHRHRRRGQKDTMVERKIKGMISIEERPTEVLDRTIPGHWEGDLIIGKKPTV